MSIVVNNFNYEAFLRQSLESALSQTHPRTEVIVADDASTDGSRDIIRSFGDRIVPVLQERNGGQAAALNAGFAASRGDLVIFLDADDYLYPHAAARVVAAWAPTIGTVQYRLHLVDREGREIEIFPDARNPFDSGDVVPKLLAAGRYRGTVTSGNAFARRTLESILPIPEEQFRISADGYLAHDGAVLWSRRLDRRAAGCLPQPRGESLADRPVARAILPARAAPRSGQVPRSRRSGGQVWPRRRP